MEKTEEAILVIASILWSMQLPRAPFSPCIMRFFVHRFLALLSCAACLCGLENK